MDNYYLRLAIENLVEANKNIDKALVNLKRAGADERQIHMVYVKVRTPLDRLISYFIDKIKKE